MIYINEEILILFRNVQNRAMCINSIALAIDPFLGASRFIKMPGLKERALQCLYLPTTIAIACEEKEKDKATDFLEGDARFSHGLLARR